MAISEGTVLAGTMAAALWLGPAQPAAAQEARQTMRIVVYDYAQVPADLLAQAQTVVSRILGEIGVDATWMDVAAFTREMPCENAARRAFVDSVVQVNVISPDMHKMLGRRNSVLGGAGSYTRRVWIAFSRIQQSARLAKADVSGALGSVVAHEIGHVLMPRGAHALTGLMQHVVDPNLVAQNRVSFLSEEATLIRATLAGDASASLEQDGAVAVGIPPWPCLADRQVDPSRGR